MKRYNITTKGYRFDKFIFWGMFLIWILLLGSQFYIHGYGHHPYFVCHAYECENPLVRGEYKCTLAFGMIPCKVECKEEWCTKPFLPKGEYGKKPINNNAFYMAMFGSLILGLVLNHFIHNKGKAFHINIMDRIEK